jgi:hypothetical protein
MNMMLAVGGPTHFYEEDLLPLPEVPEKPE